MQPLTICRQLCFNNCHWSGCGCLIGDLLWAMWDTPCYSICFTCKNQILKAIYMQITNNFSGESTNHLLIFCHHRRKLSCIRALSVKGVFAHYLCTLVFIMERICEDIHLIKSGICSSSRAEREREARVNKASQAALGRVGRWWLKLIGNVIISGKSFAAVLHLREQL